jgi:hypothetical protein
LLHYWQPFVAAGIIVSLSMQPMHALFQVQEERNFHMKTITKIVTPFFLVTALLGHTSVQAQSEQTNDAARGNSARPESRVDTNAQGNSANNGNNGATVIKEEGERATVITPGNGRAVVSTPNRGRASGPENPGRFGPRPPVSPNAP